MKSYRDSWIVASRIDDKQLYLLLDKRDLTITEAENEVKKIVGKLL